jgi:sensor histidine kinase YesM
MEKASGTKVKFSVISVHVLIWIGFFMLPFIDDTRMHISTYFIIRNLFLVLTLVTFYYSNDLILLPRLFLRRKNTAYILVVLGCILTIMVLNFIFAIVLNRFVPSEFHHPNNLHKFFIPFFPAVFVYAISTAIRITGEWFKNEKQKKDMENEKLNSELAFLKSQVNPHFLFNILNNICSLARKKSDDTENAIIKLSHIMRYMLYESKDEKVSLEKEVEYLQNYIELQRLRISDKVDINFSIAGDPESGMIEPMLLIPFVENAFKHGVSYLEESKIDISLKIERAALIFKVENFKIRKNADAVQMESGIGLRNVLRRLDLLYPGKHVITINEDGTKYIVDLKITL